MAFSARPTSSNSLTELVNLAAHGFTGGEVLIYDGAWILAKADTLAHCAGSWIVSIVPDVNSFYVTQIGYVGPFTASIGNDVPYTPGVQYYLSATNAGHLTTVKPTTVGQVILPCFVADTTTTGYFYGGSGELIESSILFNWNVVTTTPINLAVNTGYIANGAAQTTFVLPANYSPGDEIPIVDHSGHGFIISQTLGGGAQQICDLGLASTAGATGTTTTTLAGQSITLLAVVANGALRVIDNKGAFVYA